MESMWNVLVICSIESKSSHTKPLHIFAMNLYHEFHFTFQLIIDKIREKVKNERAAVVSKNNPSILRLTGTGGFKSDDPGASNEIHRDINIVSSMD